MAIYSYLDIKEVYIPKKELLKVNIKTLLKFLIMTGFKGKDVVKILTGKEAIL